jgi:ketosteroid isomerase-like protein
MAFTGSVEDRLLIRERIGAYSDATFHRDREAWLGCWADDGIWSLRGVEFRGKPALDARWDEIWLDNKCVAFYAEVGHISVDGDRATARCTVREVVLRRDGSIRKYAAAYRDALVRIDDDWLFACRDYELMIYEEN